MPLQRVCAATTRDRWLIIHFLPPSNHRIVRCQSISRPVRLTARSWGGGGGEHVYFDNMIYEISRKKANCVLYKLCELFRPLSAHKQQIIHIVCLLLPSISAQPLAITTNELNHQIQIQLQILVSSISITKLRAEFRKL